MTHGGIFKVAILEDENKESDILCSYLKTYGEENNIVFEIEVFADPIKFFNNPIPIYDIIFMDIEMPDMDGLTAAKRLREFDEKAVLIFVTNLGQFAIKGYEVHALDFVLKPLRYSGFVMRVQRAISHMKSKTEKYIMIPLAYGTIRIAISDIFFIEVRGHMLSFNTGRGIIETRGKLSDYEQMLEAEGFYRCSKCAIVNTKHIDSFLGGMVKVNGYDIIVSRNKSKKFGDMLKEVVGGRAFGLKK